MSLPATISLYLDSDLQGTSPGHGDATVFELDLRADKGVSYYSAASPQGDVAGKPKLKVSQKISRNGIMNTRFEVTVPEFDSGTGTYPTFTKDGWFSTRTSVSSVAATAQRLYGLASALVDTAGTATALIVPAADGDL
jgi:hypothetical protein